MGLQQLLGKSALLYFHCLCVSNQNCLVHSAIDMLLRWSNESDFSVACFQGFVGLFVAPLSCRCNVFIFGFN